MSRMVLAKLKAASGSVLPTLIAATSTTGTGSTGTMPTHAIGDLLVMAANNPSSPSQAVPSGWFSIAYTSGTGSIVVYLRRATSASTPHPVISGVTRMHVQSWRGAGALVGSYVNANVATSATLGYLAYNAVKINGTSIGLRFAASASTTNITANIPAGHTLIGGVAAGLLGMQLTNPLTGNVTSATQSLSSSQEWFTVPVEILSGSGLTVMGMNSIASVTSIAIPDHAIGDLIVVVASRGSTAQATKPVASGTVPAWTDIDAVTGTNSRSIRTAYFVATATNHTTGIWTNANGISVIVLRGQAASPIGGHATQNNASGINAVAPSFTLSKTDGTSLILAIYHSAGIQGAAVPAGYASLYGYPGNTLLAKQSSTSVSTATLVQSFSGGSSTTQIEIKAL